MPSLIVSVVSSAAICALSDLSLDKLRTSQLNDEECREACKYLKQKRGFDVQRLGVLKPIRKFLHVRDGLLMWKQKYVVPTEMRQIILQFAHDHSMSGHFASEIKLLVYGITEIPNYQNKQKLYSGNGPKNCRYDLKFHTHY